MINNSTIPPGTGTTLVLGLGNLLRGDEVPAEIVLFGMQPEVIELRWDLSPTIARELDKLVEAVAAELVSCGISVTPVQQAPEEARYA